MASAVAERLRRLADALDADAAEIVECTLGASTFEGTDKNHVVIGLHLEFSQVRTAPETKKVVNRLYMACREKVEG